MIQFRSMSGDDALGPPLDVPADVSPRQLELLVRKLLEATPGGAGAAGATPDAPFTFYLNAEELLSQLSSALATQGLSREAVHVVRYQPLARFRVLPVTRCTDTLPGHSEAILHVSFSPSGALLASGGGDATVRFWDARTSTAKWTCAGHGHHVLATAWSPDGLLFASGDKAGEVRVWEPSTGKDALTKPLRGHSAWVTALAWEPMHASTSESGACELLASASKDKTVRVWNTRTGTVAFVLSGHTDSVEAVKWGGGGLIYTASRDRSIIVWAVEADKSRGKVVRMLTGHGHRINSLALNVDAVLRTGPFAHDTAAGAAAAVAGVKAAFPSLAAARTAAAARYASSLASMGGAEVLVSCSDDFTLCLWKPAEDKKPIARMTGHQQLVNHLSFSPDGRYIASASFDKKVKLWDGRTGKFLLTLVGHVGSVYQVAWAADSRSLASASKDSTVKVWQMNAGVLSGATKPHALYTLSGHADEVYALDWAPGGDQMASGSKDRLLKIWRH